ncbi:MAG: hypothetical protein A2V63_12875 [Candidatus Eisenbacteria bacterium RBG_19FT_COMBO_70_11]|nr:MAG: hypothetical protein A2V63_12875 [Candidatus Eisenbacteria bacterium RBG_19FT_COMBO_70_11]
MRQEHSHALYQGLVAGVIGYAVVALFFMVVNLVAGRPALFTADVLGLALFYGVADAGARAIEPGPVLAYNGAHLLVFLLLGLAASWLVFLSERGPQFWYIGLVIFIFILFHMFGAFLLVTEPIRAAISSWSILGASLAADLAMAAYFLATHPQLRAELARTDA